MTLRCRGMQRNKPCLTSDNRKLILAEVSQFKTYMYSRCWKPCSLEVLPKMFFFLCNTKNSSNCICIWAQQRINLSYFLRVPFDKQVEGCSSTSNVLGVSSERAEQFCTKLVFLPMETWVQLWIDSPLWRIQALASSFQLAAALPLQESSFSGSCRASSLTLGFFFLSVWCTDL